MRWTQKNIKKLLKQNVTANYRKVDQETADKINKTSKKLTSELQIDDRVEVTAKKECYITLKDHKPGFPHDIKCRLINPCKSNIGQITKQILDKINSQIKHRPGPTTEHYRRNRLV